MNSSEAEKILDTSEELQITIVGRKSGREFSTPVWFVREGKTVFLLPVRGSNSQWYKNVVKSRRIKISSGKLSIDIVAKPITEPNRVAAVADKFRKKHGAGDVKKYYSIFDSAVQLTLP